MEMKRRTVKNAQKTLNHLIMKMFMRSLLTKSFLMLICTMVSHSRTLLKNWTHSMEILWTGKQNILGMNSIHQA